MATIAKGTIYSQLLFLPSILSTIYFAYLWKDYQLDDALIYLRYVRNFQAGHGLVYNPGDKFNGLTSPFFTYTIVAGSFITRNLQTLTIWISVVFLYAASFIAGKLLSKTVYGEALTTLVIVSFGYFYTTLGMETSLFLMLIALSLYLYKIQSDYFIISLALLVITRNEGIFLAVPMTIDYLICNKKFPGLKFVALGFIIFLGPLVFNYFYYGDFLPATGDAKIGQGKSGLWGKDWIFFNVEYLYEWAFSGNKYIAAFLLATSICGALIAFKEKIAIISILFLGLLLSFYGGLNIPNYHWYYAPFFFFALIFACFGVERILLKLWQHEWRASRIYITSAVVLLVCVFYLKTAPFSGGGRVEDYVNIGKWLKENTRLNSTVAMVEIGTVGWYADRYIVDILGLTNKYNAGYIANGDVVSWLSKYQPDYILRHEPRSPHEESTRYLEQEGIYVPVSEFGFPGFVLLEKSGRYSDAEIAAVPSLIKESRLLLNSMLSSSKFDSSHVQMDTTGLFAHAPSTLSLILPKATTSISVSYGIKDGAQGKHYGVCFEVVKEKTAETVFRDCIDRHAESDRMSRRKVVTVGGLDGDVFLFKTRCTSTCGFAWSYWSEVLIQ